MQAALFIDTENLPGFACAAEGLMLRKFGEHQIGYSTVSKFACDKYSNGLTP
jgi:hypothetical protein